MIEPSLIEPSLVSVFIEQCSKSPDKPLYGTINMASTPQVRWVSYIEALDMAIALVDKLRGTLLGDIVGIYSVNRFECMVAECAIHILGKASCIIHHASTLESVSLYLRETQMRSIFASQKCATFLQTNGFAKQLSHLVVFDKDFVSDAFVAIGVRVTLFSDAALRSTQLSLKRFRSESEIHTAALAQINALGCELPRTEAFATLCYTSGTTGGPKGVVLAHSNFLALIGAFSDKSLLQIVPSDLYFSYLPISHVMEHGVISVVIAHGASVGFYGGDPKRLVDDMRILRPTMFAAVPKVLQKICDEVQKKFKESPSVKKLYKMETTGATKLVLAALGLNFVSKKIRKRFGGRIRACMSGGSRLDPDLCVEVQDILGCTVFQGYGQTETTGAVAIRAFKSGVVDTVGAPLRCSSVKIVDGEVFVKGSAVFRGYFKNDELTKNAFVDGWFKTGDEGVLESDGTLRISGRKSDIFKISNGEFVAPESLETLLAVPDCRDVLVVATPAADGICVVAFGDSKDVAAAVFENARKLCAENKIRAYEIPRSVVAVSSEMFAELDSFYTLTGKKQRTKLIKRLAELGIFV